MLDRLPARAGVGVRERAELVGVLLSGRVREGVGVHRVEAEAEAACRLLEPVRVGLVPGMCSETVGVARVSWWMTAQSSILSKMSRGSPGAGEAGEARAAGANTPGRHRDVERCDLVADGVDGDAAARELLAEVAS